MSLQLDLFEAAEYVRTELGDNSHIIVSDDGGHGYTTIWVYAHPPGGTLNSQASITHKMIQDGDESINTIDLFLKDLVEQVKEKIKIEKEKAGL